MAIKTVWPITFACGHSEARDLSGKKADERAGFARWLAAKECTSCWRKAQGDDHDDLTKEEWIAQKRAEERERIDAWESSSEMGPLTGSEKAADWGARCRYELLTAAYTALVETETLAEEQFIVVIEQPARKIDAASWWIDNRDTAPEDLRELIGAAQETAAVSSENPY